MERTIPGRAGPRCRAAGRTRRSATRRHRPPPAGRRAHLALQRAPWERRRAPGGGMTGTATIQVGQFGRPTLSKDGRTITVRIPINLRHHGGSKQIATPAGATPWLPARTRGDSTLVKAIVRAHRQPGMLRAGAYATVPDLAPNAA